MRRSAMWLGLGLLLSVTAACGGNGGSGSGSGGSGGSVSSSSGGETSSGGGGTGGSGGTTAATGGSGSSGTSTGGSVAEGFSTDPDKPVALVLGEAVSETIDVEATHYFRFTPAEAGLYTLALTTATTGVEMQFSKSPMGGLCNIDVGGNCCQGTGTVVFCEHDANGDPLPLVAGQDYAVLVMSNFMATQAEAYTVVVTGPE